jgi:hypothetical protein
MILEHGVEKIAVEVQGRLALGDKPIDAGLLAQVRPKTRQDRDPAVQEDQQQPREIETA